MTMPLSDIPTEQRNPRTIDLDTMPTMEILRLINEEDQRVAGAVSEVLPEIGIMVDRAVETLRRGGRVHYFGAGTSGRLAVLDAAELLPTFGIERGRIVAHNAGGMGALYQSVENVEDDDELGARDADNVRTGDVAIGIAASGRTPYVVGALRASAGVGAFTVLLSANPSAPYGDEVDLHIAPATGPEVISGSTRMKAGTATKLVLNAFSTTVMVRMGRTYSNLMVSLTGVNEKLRHRLVRILAEATDLDPAICEEALAEAGGDTRVALVALLCEVPAGRAATALQAGGGAIREAIARLSYPL
jgi:N-acetylmuramic acid 6-phosphate etherase